MLNWGDIMRSLFTRVQWPSPAEQREARQDFCSHLTRRQTPENIDHHLSIPQTWLLHRNEGEHSTMQAEYWRELYATYEMCTSDRKVCMSRAMEDVTVLRLLLFNPPTGGSSQSLSSITPSTCLNLHLHLQINTHLRLNCAPTSP